MCKEPIMEDGWRSGKKSQVLTNPNFVRFLNISVLHSSRMTGEGSSLNSMDR